MNQRMIPPLMIAFALLSVAPPAWAQGKAAEKGKQGEARGSKQQGGADKAQGAPQQGKRENPSRGQGAQKQEGRGNQDRAQSPQRNDNRGNARADDTGRGNSGNDRAVAARDNRGRFSRSVTLGDVKPNLRRYANSSRAPERIAAGALTRGLARGLGDDEVRIRQNGNRTSLFNNNGVVLVDMDDERARNLGGWRVDPWDDDVKSDAPSFCRSGEGHPVFGREWCLQKGFGLGDYRDLRWGRSLDVGDIIFQRQVDRGTLARAVLIDVLGDVVFNRLGLHAITLGYSDPLSGVWLGEPTGPSVLRISSGPVQIAEIYDDDRDNRADVLLVALRPW